MSTLEVEEARYAELKERLTEVQATFKENGTTPGVTPEQEGLPPLRRRRDSLYATVLEDAASSDMVRRCSEQTTKSWMYVFGRICQSCPHFVHSEENRPPNTCLGRGIEVTDYSQPRQLILAVDIHPEVPLGCCQIYHESAVAGTILRLEAAHNNNK
jgi:hypothetical protein